MRAVVQIVKECAVHVDGRLTGKIGAGLLVYLGVGKNDAEREVGFICDKIINLRVFPDAAGKMNLSLLDVRGEILVVSQFTLFGDAREGRRPSYTQAAEPSIAKGLYESVLACLAAKGLTVAHGEFQADMEVSYTNMGPVTILLDSEKSF